MPIPKISIRALRAFVAVYEEQSFSRAAARENATQSGMSTQVKNLEEKLGTPLLVRDRKEYTLTPAGQLVYREGQNILKALLATETAVTEMQDEVSGLVRFGLIPSLTRAVLTPALEQFKSEFPKVELSLVEEYSFSLMRRVLDGELDFAFVPAGDIPSGLTARFVGRDREMVVSRPGARPAHPHLSPMPLSALSGARLIVPTRQNVRRKRIETMLSAHGVHVAEMMEMDGMLATLEMVGNTDWAAILPSAICHNDIGGRHRKLNVLSDPPMSFDYVIVEKSEAPPPRAANLLAEQIVHHTNAILADWTDLRGIA
ncbi:MAG: LysR family transcriptional regulator [Flavimaricola sp.]|nr:LysR family transcriptional regulator [Flavimaricola sp.]